MDFETVVRRRRMVRNFDDRPLPPDVVQRILRNTQRAPSAGFSQGWAFLVLEGTDETASFWASTFDDDTARAGFRWPGLFNAPLLVVAMSHKQAYLDRYAEPDKGWVDRDERRWPAPYWDIDTGFAALLMLLTAIDAGLGALFFGIMKPGPRSAPSSACPPRSRRSAPSPSAGRYPTHPRHHSNGGDGPPSRSFTAGDGDAELGEQGVDVGHGLPAGVVPAHVGEAVPSALEQR